MLPEPLPDVFGNYAIKGIAEVLPPDPVSWLPTTQGWQLLGVLALLVLLRWSLQRYRRWRRNRYRRLALRALERLVDAPPEDALSRIAALLKATALNAGSRREVAGLSGQPWLDWLDAATEAPVFSADSRTLLVSSQYHAAPPGRPDALADLAREVALWIQQHRETAP